MGDLEAERKVVREGQGRLVGGRMTAQRGQGWVAYLTPPSLCPHGSARPLHPPTTDHQPHSTYTTTTPSPLTYLHHRVVLPLSPSLLFHHSISFLPKAPFYHNETHPPVTFILSPPPSTCNTLPHPHPHPPLPLSSPSLTLILILPHSHIQHTLLATLPTFQLQPNHSNVTVFLKYWTWLFSINVEKKSIDKSPP